ncbi:MAG TPA: tyrosine/phenylalanine carboxypeptidase domain-containing protein [Candidatus Polarisedimenticolia bacterium]|nr:tyrosine/phenylalanine carboxypeptidase domain-containing protein [Candidatus Polarisedimenticolia bacterium]
MDRDLERCVDLDRRLVEAAKGIKILSNLDWPATLCAEFLSGWQAGSPRLPQVPHPRHDFGENVAVLETVMAECDPAHPVGHYIWRTAASYVTAARMLESRGTPAFTEMSCALYGRPGDDFGRAGLTNLDAAEHFIHATDDLAAVCALEETDLCVLPSYVASQLREKVAAFFKDHEIEVTIDPGLAAKAAAGARRLRIRSATCFAPADLGQLLQHEAFVHTATMFNGREQPYLKSLGLGAPRTTCTQEGLATFAELITTTMDLSRLRRLALRIRAVQQALDGADFIEVFRFFLESGQNQRDSFQSARRVFRGGDPRGRIVFTKDVIYVQGLVFTHTFLRKAIQSGKVEYPHYLFAGRLTWGDVISLEPYFQNGFIAGPLYEPEWVANRLCLAAYLTYSIFANRIHLGEIRLEDFLAGG